MIPVMANSMCYDHIISYLIVEGVGRNPALVEIDKTKLNMGDM